MNRKSKITTYVVITLLLVLSLGWYTPLGRLTLSYVLYKIYPAAFVTNKVIRNGTYKGISIGDDKTQVLRDIERTFGSSAQINESELTLGKTGVLVPLQYLDRHENLLRSHQVWLIYFESNFANRLRLTFNENGELVEIQRYIRKV